LRVWRAEPAEAADVARLIAEFGAWWGQNVVPEDEVRASVERIMSGDDGEFLLGAVDGEPLGVCQLRFRWSVWKSAEDCWLEDLFVREEARRSGDYATADAKRDESTSHGWIVRDTPEGPRIERAP